MIEKPLIPTLETERLLLRPFVLEDLDPFAAIVGNPQVIGNATYSGQTMNRNQAFNWICMMLGHWHLRGFGIWAVEQKSSGDFIGRIGLQYLDWFDDVELVWMLDYAAWGKGFGTEGARAAIEYGLGPLQIPALTAVIRTDNEPSQRLAKRLGMIRDRDLEREGVSFVEYRISKQPD